MAASKLFAWLTVTAIVAWVPGQWRTVVPQKPSWCQQFSRPTRLGEDAHAELAGAGRAWLAEHCSQRGGVLEHLAAEEGAVEAG